MSGRYDLVIVGGGLVGGCLAEELAAGGATVLVLDAGPAPGHATALAAGVAVPALRYAADPSFSDWLTAAKHALRDDIDRLTPEYGAFSVARPVLRVLLPQDVDGYAAALDRGYATGGIIGEQDVADLLPQSRLPADCRVALGDGLMVDGPRYLQAVQAAAIGAGACWWQGALVTEIDDGADGVALRCADGRYATGDRMVLAAGAWTGRLTGGRLPISPQRGQLAVLDTPEPLRCIVSSRLYMAPLPSGATVVGATEETAGFDLACTAAGVAQVLAFAIRTLPRLGTAALLQTRAGLRPVSGTGRPLVGRVPWSQRVYVASGHAGHGLLSARYTARGAAAGLLHKDWNAVPIEFCPNKENTCV